MPNLGRSAQSSIPLDASIAPPQGSVGRIAPIDCLLRWDAHGDEPEAAYRRLRAHPRYGMAAQIFAHNMLAQAEADPALDGILKDAGRNVAAKCLAYLHVTGGLTLPRLKALCASIGLVSPGRARALLLYLRYVGYVQIIPSRRKGAPAHHLPTDRFLKTWRNHMRSMLEVAAAIEEAANIVLHGLAVAGVFETFVRCISECYLEGLRNIDSKSPFFRVFMHSYAGTQLVHLLVTGTPGVFPPQEPFALSISATARRFGVSRTHIHRMLVAAEREGLLRFQQDGIICLQSSGREAIDHIYATQILVFLIAAARTPKARPDLAGASQVSQYD